MVQVQYQSHSCYEMCEHIWPSDYCIVGIFYVVNFWTVLCKWLLASDTELNINLYFGSIKFNVDCINPIIKRSNIYCSSMFMSEGLPSKM